MRWTDPFLDTIRTEGDPDADAAIDVLVRAGTARTFDAWLQAHPHNGDPLPADTPEAVRAVFAAAAASAAAADPALLDAGRGLFFRYGLPCLQGLLLRSLPELYASAPGAAVLQRSRRMAGDAERRIFETLQFVVDVLSPDAFAPGARGVRSTVRVRLMHAAARWRIGQAPDASDFEGMAINQEDLAATLVSFSALLLDVLHRLGVDTSREEDAAWIGTWRVTGAMLGIRPDLLPHDVADALALFDAFRRRHHRPSAAGRELTAALLAFADTLVPGEALDGLNAVALRTLSGDTLADLLGVPKSDWTRAFVSPYRALVALGDLAQDHSPAARAVGARAGRAFVTGLLERRMADGRPAFSIPRALSVAWDVGS